MSEFSSYLQDIIRQKKVTVSHLAQSCNVDRTLLHKYISGTRLPNDVSFLAELCDELMLTPNQKNELFEKFSIASIGENAFRQRQIISEMIEGAYRFDSASGFLGGGYNMDYLDSLGGFRSFENGTVLANVAAQIVSLEATKNGGRIMSVTQGKGDFAKMITRKSGNPVNYTIEQIVCIDASDAEDSVSRNLRIIADVLPLIVTNENFFVYYYYDRIESHLNEMSALPYMIITSDFVLTYDIAKIRGTLLRGNEAVRFYTALFERYKSQSFSLLAADTPINEICARYSKSPKLSAFMAYSPPVAMGMSRGLLEKIVDEGGRSEDVIDYISLSLQQFSVAHPPVVYYCPSGLELFLRGGEVGTLFGSASFPVPEPYRRDIISRLYKLHKDGRAFFVPLNERRIRLAERLVIMTFGDRTLEIIVSVGTGKRYITINDKGIVAAFNDYFRSLPDRDEVLDDIAIESIYRKAMSGGSLTLE